MDLTNLTQADLKTLTDALLTAVLVGVMSGLFIYDCIIGMVSFVAKKLRPFSKVKSNLRLANMDDRITKDSQN